MERQFDGGTKLAQLRAMSVVVADTGDLDAVRRLRPVDCTTNPSLILKAFKNPSNGDLVDEAIEWGRKTTLTKTVAVSAVCDRLSINFGVELVKLIPGRVSIELDATLSFNAERSIEKAYDIIASFRVRGVERDRILIKLAATWEGIRAAEILQRDGIDCNLTLVFGQTQAIACAEAGAFLISPFVGRILDWNVKAGNGPFDTESDPGVLSVRAIYSAYKSQGIGTIIMAASFRSQSQIEALAGCDRMTISPTLLDVMETDIGNMSRCLSPPVERSVSTQAVMTESVFRWQMNEDPMETEKLSEGIRIFAADLEILRELVAERL